MCVCGGVCMWSHHETSTTIKIMNIYVPFIIFLSFHFRNIYQTYSFPANSVLLLVTIDFFLKFWRNGIIEYYFSPFGLFYSIECIRESSVLLCVLTVVIYSFPLGLFHSVYRPHFSIQSHLERFFSSFGYYKISFYEHLGVSLCFNICFVWTGSPG